MANLAEVATDRARALSPTEFALIEAFAEAVVPSDPGDPGALEAGSADYIELALGGAYEHLLPQYRYGVEQLDALARRRHSATFTSLSLDDRVDLLLRVTARFFSEADDVTTDEADVGEFVQLARLHVLEGMFGDPAYGGNQDMIGWKLIGFPGAQWGYSQQQRAYGFDATTIEPQSLHTLATKRRLGLIT